MKISEYLLAFIVIAGVTVAVGTLWTGFIGACTTCPANNFSSSNLSYFDRANDTSQTIDNLTKAWSNTSKQSLSLTDTITAVIGLPASIFAIANLILVQPIVTTYSLIHDVAEGTGLIPGWFVVMVMGGVGLLLIFGIISLVTRYDA